jgi:hypothetical protein
MVQKRSSSPNAVQIEGLVTHFIQNEYLIAGFLKQVLVHLGQSTALKDLIHTTRSRVKDPDHLRDKLFRYARAAQDAGKSFNITRDNLFRRVTDLAGIRLLHLHTSQIAAIDKEIRSIIREQKFPLLEGPFARTWDDEYREFFKKIGIKPQKSPTIVYQRSLCCRFRIPNNYHLRNTSADSYGRSMG